MLQLPCGVGLAVDIADLLHFQAALQAGGVIRSPAQEEDVPGVGELGGEPLDAALVLQHAGDLVRQGGQLLNVSRILVLHEFPPHQGQLHRQGVHGHELGTVGLGGGHGDLRPRQGVEHIVRLPGDGGAYHVHHRQCPRPLPLRLPQGGQRVRCLPGLGDNDD